MIQLTQMEHRCTVGIPHALWSSNRRLLMHSLMQLWLTKRMVMVNNARTNPALYCDSQWKRDGGGGGSFRLADVASLFSSSDFLGRAERLKPL